MSFEYHESAVGVFLGVVHRAMDSTGKRPMRNVVSSALFAKILDEAGRPTLIPCDDPVVYKVGQTYLCGYPVKVVISENLFALSLDSEDGSDV